MKRVGIVWFLCFGFISHLSAQVSDDFTDGDFTANPVWSGDDDKFEIDETGKLHLNAPAVSDQAYLSTSSEAIEEAVWEFYVEIGENPSNSNFTSIYLVSDQADLIGELNGYFVKIGGTADEVSLYRQDGSGSAEIIDGLDDRVDMKPVTLRVKVTRDGAGNWELFSDNTGGTTYISEGTVADDTYAQSNYFGIYCKYTSTRSDKFYFDDFAVSGNPVTDEEPTEEEPTEPTDEPTEPIIDEIPPELLTLTVLSSDSLQLQFSEPLAKESAEILSNYAVGNLLPAKADLQDSSDVLLTFNSPFINGSTHTLTISQVTDTSGNVMLATDKEFTYFEPVSATYRDIVINEIFPDPNPPVDSLPSDSDAEFIELFNNSAHPFDLNIWTINDAVLPSFLLQSGQFVILCKSTYSTDFGLYGDVIGLNIWPTLSNSGTTILLKDSSNSVIDSLTYTSSQITGGYSLEQINPNPPCLNSDNFTTSTHPNGASPGMQNAVFNDTPDMTAPNLISITVDSVNRLSLYFDEMLEENSSQEVGNYSMTGGLEVVAVKAENQQVNLTFSTDFKQGETYAVSVANITDCSGNVVINNSQSFHYDVQPPEIRQIIVTDTSTIEVIWDEDITKSPAEKESNYAIENMHPKSAKLNGDGPKSVALIFSKAFGEGMHLLHAIGISDTLGNSIADSLPASFSFMYQNQVDSVVVIDGNLLEVYFGETVDEQTSENVGNYEVNRDVGHPGVAILSEDKRKVTLIFGRHFSENKEHMLVVRNILNASGTLLSIPVQRFFYDTQAPKITAVSVLAVDSLLLSFDEKIDRNSAEKTDNYEVLERGNPVIAQWQYDSISVLLVFAQNFKPEFEHELTVNGIEDLKGNVSSKAQTTTFLYDPLPPTVLETLFLSPQQIRLTFSEPLDSGSVFNVVFYRADQNLGVPDTVKWSEVYPNQVELMFNDGFQDDLTYALSIQNLSDVKGNVMVIPDTVQFSNQFPSLVNLVPFSDKELLLKFSKNISSETAENPDHYKLEGKGMPIMAALNTENQTEVKLVFAESFLQKKSYELVLENISDEKGNTTERLQTTFVYDTKISAIRVAGNNIIHVDFTVPLAISNANNPLNFAVDQGVGNPEAAVLDEDILTRLTLYFSQNLSLNKLYHLSTTNLKDTFGQLIPNSTALFGSGEKPGFHELLITEIMADPTPPNSLPEADYLEVFNPTDKILGLDGMQLSDAVSTTSLPDVLVKPGEYIILCSTEDVEEFSTFGRVIGVSGFPSLNSAEDEISLRNADGKLIFSITYKDDWYKDSQKAAGGWSLEMVDFIWPCGEDENWTASEDARGGTPGQANSIRASNPDGMGPQLINAQPASDTTIQLIFDEKLKPSSITHGKFSGTPSITIDSIFTENEQNQVWVQLQEALQPKTLYTIQVENISDCNSNLINSAYNSFSFYLPETSDSLDILLNEVLFAPRSGGEKFVELYNQSDKYINLKNWKLANFAGDTVSNFKVITADNFILYPHTFLVLTEDATILQADYPQTQADRVLEVSTLPSYPIAEGTVVLVNDRDEVVQIFEYTDDFHFPLLKEEKGVSLERISWDEQVNDSNNWHSAASTAGYATPGFMNSQYRKYEEISAQFEVEPRVFLPDNSGQADFTSIRYQLDEPGHVATIQIYDAYGRKVKDLLQNAILSTEDAIQWDGTDNQHQKVKMGYYLIYIEVFHLNGEKQIFKEKVAVTARF